MAEETKTYSQVFDNGVRGGLVALIGEKVFSFLVVLAAFADRDGVCYPPEDQLARLMGVSERTIRNRITAAKKTIYKDIPPLAVRKNKKKKGGALLFDNNIYIISKPIWNDLIGRYYSSGKILPSEKNEQASAQSQIPAATLSPVKKLPHNDSHSFNENKRNDKEKSPVEKKYKPKITLAAFKETINNQGDGWLFQMATWLGELDMDFLLSARSDPKCGMRGIEWAYNRTKEDCDTGKVRNKGRYFNKLVREYKNGGAAK